MSDFRALRDEEIDYYVRDCHAGTVIGIMARQLQSLRPGGEEKNGVGVKPGWVFVPVKPTPEMLATQGKSRPDLARTEQQRKTAEMLNANIRKMAAETWDEMLAAAPALTNSDLSLRAENERLRGMVDGYGKLDAEYAIAERRATTAEAKLEEAAKVLEPFAAYIKARDDSDPDMPDDAPAVSYSAELRGPVVAATIGDFRAARSFLANLKGAE